MPPCGELCCNTQHYRHDIFLFYTVLVTVYVIWIYMLSYEKPDTLNLQLTTDSILKKNKSHPQSAFSENAGSLPESWHYTRATATATAICSAPSLKGLAEIWRRASRAWRSPKNWEENHGRSEVNVVSNNLRSRVCGL